MLYLGKYISLPWILFRTAVSESIDLPSTYLEVFCLQNMYLDQRSILFLPKSGIHWNRSAMMQEKTNFSFAKKEKVLNEWIKKLQIVVWRENLCGSKNNKYSHNFQ